MTKEHWLDLVIQVVGKDRLHDTDLVQLKSMTRRQLVVVEFLLVAMRDDACGVGCGDCDWCKAQNAAAQAAYDAKNPVIGKKVEVLPMTPASRRWINQNAPRKHVVTMIARKAERFSVKAPNGRRKTFGPLDATWSVRS